jgi:hypothetical protein
MFVNSLMFLAAVTFVYYLFARAEITRFLWSRYPSWLDKLARCPACSGTWIGLALGTLYVTPPPHPERWRWERPVWSAVWGLLLTPIGAWVITRAIVYIEEP